MPLWSSRIITETFTKRGKLILCVPFLIKHVDNMLSGFKCILAMLSVFFSKISNISDYLVYYINGGILLFITHVNMYLFYVFPSMWYTFG